MKKPNITLPQVHKVVTYVAIALLMLAALLGLVQLIGFPLTLAGGFAGLNVLQGIVMTLMMPFVAASVMLSFYRMANK